MGRSTSKGMSKLKIKSVVFLLVFVLFLLPIVWIPDIYKNPEEPVQPDLPFYSQEYGRRHIIDIEQEEVTMRADYFYLVSQEIPRDDITFTLDLHEANVENAKGEKAWFQIEDRYEELEFQDQYENGILLMNIALPKLNIKSGEQLKIECLALIENEIPSDLEFTRHLAISKTTEFPSWPGKKIGVIGVSYPNTYQISNTSWNAGEKTKVILFPRRSEKVVSLDLLFVDLEEEGDIGLSCRILPYESNIFSPSQGFPISYEGTDTYDSIEIVVEIMDEKYRISINAHLSNTGDEDIYSVLDPLVYFVAFPQETVISKCHLENGSILLREEEEVVKNVKIAELKRKDSLPILHPGESTWVKVEATIPHEMDLTERKVFDLPLVPVIAWDDKVHVTYSLKLPQRAIMLAGFPEGYLLRKGNILEWNYDKTSQGEVFFFAASFINNVRLPVSNRIASNTFLFVFLVSWVAYLFACYKWHQHAKTLIPIGIALALWFFYCLHETINPSDIRLLTYPSERLKTAFLWAYLPIFSLSSLLVLVVRRNAGGTSRPIFVPCPVCKRKTQAWFRCQWCKTTWDKNQLTQREKIRRKLMR